MAVTYYLSYILFSGDIVLFAETNEKLEKIINILSEESEKVGLKMNQDKTKVMTNSSTDKISLYGKPMIRVRKQLYISRKINFI